MKRNGTIINGRITYDIKTLEEIKKNTVFASENEKFKNIGQYIQTLIYINALKSYKNCGFELFMEKFGDLVEKYRKPHTEYELQNTEIIELIPYDKELRIQAITSHTIPTIRATQYCAQDLYARVKFVQLTNLIKNKNLSSPIKAMLVNTFLKETKTLDALIIEINQECELAKFKGDLSILLEAISVYKGFNKPIEVYSIITSDKSSSSYQNIYFWQKHLTSTYNVNIDHKMLNAVLGDGDIIEFGAKILDSYYNINTHVYDLFSTENNSSNQGINK